MASVVWRSIAKVRAELTEPLAAILMDNGDPSGYDSDHEDQVGPLIDFSHEGDGKFGGKWALGIVFERASFEYDSVLRSDYNGSEFNAPGFIDDPVLLWEASMEANYGQAPPAFAGFAYACALEWDNADMALNKCFGVVRAQPNKQLGYPNYRRRD